MNLFKKVLVLCLSMYACSSYAEIKLKYLTIPQSSDDYYNCLNVKPESYCLDQQRKNYPTYDELSIIYKDDDILKFFTVEKKLELSVNTIVLIPEKNKGTLYGIGERYLERNDDDGEVNYYLLKFRPNAEVINLGAYYAIDKDYNLFYKDTKAKLKKIKLY